MGGPFSCEVPRVGTPGRPHIGVGTGPGLRVSTDPGAGAPVYAAHMARQGARGPAVAAVAATFAAVGGLVGGMVGLVHAPSVADAVVLAAGAADRVAVGRARPAGRPAPSGERRRRAARRGRSGAVPDLRARGVLPRRPLDRRACPTRWSSSRSSRARGCGGTCRSPCWCCTSRTGGCPGRAGGGWRGLPAVPLVFMLLNARRPGAVPAALRDRPARAGDLVPPRPFPRWTWRASRCSPALLGLLVATGWSAVVRSRTRGCRAAQRSCAGWRWAGCWCRARCCSAGRATCCSAARTSSSSDSR